MTPRAAVRLAWGLWGLALALVAAALAVNAVHAWSYSGVLAVLSLAFLTVGAFLAGRRPANAVGWLLLGWGMVMAFVTLTGAYVDRATVRDPGSLPGPEWVAWAEATVWHPAFSLLAFLLLLFPHGRLPSPRWRPFAWFVVAVYLVLSLAAAVSPEPSRSTIRTSRARWSCRSPNWPNTCSTGCSLASCCCSSSPWCRWCCGCAGPRARNASRSSGSCTPW